MLNFKNMITVSQFAAALERLAPLAYQENYDNCGLLVGDPKSAVSAVLTALEITPEVIEEAIELKANLIVAHHPVIFGGIKRLTPQNPTGQLLIRAIQNGLNLYALHTPLDKIPQGISGMLCKKLELSHCQTLAPERNKLSQLTVFVPHSHKQILLEALAHAGAGEIGNYTHCSFAVEGKGTFRPNEAAQPYIGAAGQIETVDESRVEVIFPTHLTNKVLSAMRSSHPYEEIAHFVYALENIHPHVGLGMVGLLPRQMQGEEFLAYAAQKLGLTVIRHTTPQPVHKVAVCGGAGAPLLAEAIAQQADVLLTADFKYHQFFEAGQKIMIADIGHYESERFAGELLAEYLSPLFPEIPVRTSSVNTNPVRYFIYHNT